MALVFENISHTYDQGKILKGVNLTAERGEVTCILGPSGCGKTTLLKLAAGLIDVQEGSIRVDGNNLAEPGLSIPPEKRSIGLVFQEGALFPHLSVESNIAFGLSKDKIEKDNSVTEQLSRIGLMGFGNRFPHTLSGGQQQRVALARALAPSPKVLLLDEPFANIDSQLRRDLREDTRRTLKESDTITVLVTHDPDEALEMADNIAVMEKGRVAQIGTPQELYDSPATADIAKMFGRGQSIAATIAGNYLETPFGDWSTTCLSTDAINQGAAEIIVRQDMFDISDESGGKGTNSVIDVRITGHGLLAFVEGSEQQILRIQLPRHHPIKVGDNVAISPRDRSVFGFAQQA